MNKLFAFTVGLSSIACSVERGDTTTSESAATTSTTYGISAGDIARVLSSGATPLGATALRSARITSGAEALALLSPLQHSSGGYGDQVTAAMTAILSRRGALAVRADDTLFVPIPAGFDAVRAGLASKDGVVFHLGGLVAQEDCERCLDCTLSGAEPDPCWCVDECEVVCCPGHGMGHCTHCLEASGGAGGAITCAIAFDSLRPGELLLGRCP